MTDEQFATAFSDCSLPPESFNHEGHLRLAWIHLEKSDLESAIKTVCNQIAAYANYQGATDKYHHTLSIAAVHIVHHFMGKSQSAHFTGFINEFPPLKTDFKSLISSHYGFDIFSSSQAKTEYIAPDLLPFE